MLSQIQLRNNFTYINRKFVFWFLETLVPLFKNENVKMMTFFQKNAVSKTFDIKCAATAAAALGILLISIKI